MSLREPTPEFLDGLRARLGPSGARAPADAPGFLTEPRGRVEGRAALIARPADTEAVAAVVRACAEARVALIPVGGGTGLVLGQIAPSGPTPVLLSLERMRAIRAVSREEDALIAEAGVPLAEVQAAAAEVGRLFPLSLASEGSCQIGGNLAANAGGVSVLRYGNARDLCLGIEAVLPSGEILRGLKTLRKDNTGFDIRHLLIGSEGTLGVITAAALKLFPRPAETAAAFVSVPSVEAAITLMRRLQDALGDAVTAFELISQTSLDFLMEGLGGPRSPLEPGAGPWFALVEAGGVGVEARIEESLAEGFESGLIGDGTLAANEAQRAAFWRLREEIPAANRAIGAIASHDVSLPIGRIAAFVKEGERQLTRLDPVLRINCFGHLGDGNLHYNVFAPKGRKAAEFAAVKDQATRLVHDLVHEFGGSFSAEHGVGRLKVADLERYGDPAKLSAMRAIKRALDPIGFMNPGAVLAPLAEDDP